MTEHILEIDSLIKTVGFRSLLTDVYLKCTSGEVLGILGRNGSGKSTLLKIIFGSIDADNKSIRFDHVLYQKPFCNRDLIAFLPQHPFLPGNQSVSQIARIFLRDRSTREHVLGHQKIKPHLNKRISDLSAGERRYFEVLLILNRPAPFALLDEPFSGVAPLYKTEIKALIQTHKKEKGIILTDHDHANLMDVSDRVFLIDRGVCRSITEKDQLVRFNYLPPVQAAEDTGDESFTADPQTLKDLGLDDIQDPDGFFSIFDTPQSKGGKAQLDKLFRSPTRSKITLENRQQAIRFFQDHGEILKIKSKQLDFISYYLDSGIATSSASLLDALVSSVKNRYRASNDYYIKETGIRYACDFLKNMERLSTAIQHSAPPPYLSYLAFSIQEMVNKNALREFVSGFEQKPFFLYISTYDYLLRKKVRQEMTWLLEAMYQLEAWQAVGKSTLSLNFRFPKLTDSTTPEIEVKGLYHPKIPDAIDNDFYLSERANLCFLTGANMSGKSSFLKALGIAIYLAHLGFPVPASRMKVSLFDGLITTINLSDNLNLGLSHFYSEVIRVKEVAIRLKNKERLVVIFDELFRGTNVKDAASASSLIIDALSKLKGSAYIISSHILEIASELETNKNIFFKCFDTKLVDNEPKYTYKLKDGVSTDSHGFNIVLREQILELLQGTQ